MIWLQGAAWWGLAAIALPILIHLLARERSRRLLFPSLKFLHESQVAALRRRAVDEWPLLLVRALILAAAVAALAAPVFVSGARRAAWDARFARALIVVDGTEGAAPVAEDEARSSFVHRVFTTSRPADAVADAVQWLDHQPPAAREIVVIGDLREGVLAGPVISSVPAHVGLRFLPLPPPASNGEFELRAAAADVAGRTTATTIRVAPDSERTRARYEPAAMLTPQIGVAAAPADQAIADAIVRAVIGDGVMLERAQERRLSFVFNGAPAASAAALAAPEAAWMREVLASNPEVRGGDANGTLIVRVPMAVTDPAAGGIVSRVVTSAFAVSLAGDEPRRIPAATLARWSRAPGAAPESATPVDEQDRRWFWGAVLALVAIEQVLRKRQEPSATDEDAGITSGAVGSEDARVA